MADAGQTTVWRWDQAEPFGVNAANEDPDGNSVAFDLPLRLPGQYFDKETGLHYNYFRDYDASLGRYVESDPIGLRGGINTYLYASSPLGQIDPMGLMGQSSSGSNWKSIPRPPSVRSDGKPWGWGCGDVVADRYVPDSIDGVSFIRPCRNHDACYETCGIPKATCDKRFYDDIVDECTGAGRPVGGTCMWAARAYAAAMSTRASQEAFERARRKCVCQP